jgi:hypothetical protein
MLTPVLVKVYIYKSLIWRFMIIAFTNSASCLVTDYHTRAFKCTGALRI